MKFLAFRRNFAWNDISTKFQPIFVHLLFWSAQKVFIDRQMQKSDDKPFWWRSFSSYNRRENMKITSLSSKFWRQSQIAAFWSWETKWWCTLLLRSWIQLLERLVKPRALKWQQKWSAKTQALTLGWRINLHMWWCSETCLLNLEYTFALN